MHLHALASCVVLLCVCLNMRPSSSSSLQVSSMLGVRRRHLGVNKMALNLWMMLLVVGSCCSLLSVPVVAAHDDVKTSKQNLSLTTKVHSSIHATSREAVVGLEDGSSCTCSREVVWCNQCKVRVYDTASLTIDLLCTIPSAYLRTYLLLKNNQPKHTRISSVGVLPRA